MATMQDISGGSAQVAEIINVIEGIEGIAFQTNTSRSRLRIKSVKKCK